MNLVMGYANPELQRVLLELVLSGKSSREPNQPNHSDQPTSSELIAQTKRNTALLDAAISADTLTGEQSRVLPLLARTSVMENLSQPSQTTVLGLYKYTLCRNSLMIHRLAEIQRQFQEVNFEPMIGMKGLPALAYLGQSVGVRPMADVDVLVPGLQKHLPQAISLLERLGYRQKELGVRSLTVVSPENMEIDLHWHVHGWAMSDELVRCIKRHATAHSFQTQSFYIPCIEHHLAHTLAHGVLTNSLVYDARWVFDFLAVFQRVKVINDERFAEFANQVVAPSRIRSALEALVEHTPKTVDFDRQKLISLTNALKTNSWFISWLYQQTPTPSPEHNRVRHTPRSDRVKQILIAMWVQTKALTKGQNLSGFVKKLVFRGPVFIYRLVTGR